MEVITWHYIAIADWKNIMVKMIEPQGVLYKIPKVNPHTFKTHKIDPYNRFHDYV